MDGVTIRNTEATLGMPTERIQYNRVVLEGGENKKGMLILHYSNFREHLPSLGLRE